MSQPPSREARFFAEEQGLAREDARLSPFDKIAGWTRGGLDFRGDATGRIWLVSETRDGRAELAFTSNKGDGVIRLDRGPRGWMRVEVWRHDALALRVWMDLPYEDLEFWPDGAAAAGDPPGRVSKRGSWLDVDASAFPGLPANKEGRFQLDDGQG